MKANGRTAVVLFNLGGPDGPDAVAPFLFNLFNDPAIIGLPAPFRGWLARLISRRRAPEATQIYRHLGGASPLLENTRAQAAVLETALQGRVGNARCFIAMRYWRPFADAAAAEVRDWGADRVVLLPLYPQYSTTTVGSSLKDWARAARKAGLTTPTASICCYPRLDGMITAMARFLRETLQQLPAPRRAACRVLFSAHGLPKKIVAGGDPYQWQVEQTAAAVAAKLGADMPADWRVCYQSRVGPLEWIRPYTEDEIKQAGADGVPLLLLPVAFVSEHSETLVELDIEYRQLAMESGVPVYLRAPTVGAAPEFIDALAELTAITVADCSRFGAGPDSAETGRLCPGSGRRCPNAHGGADVAP